MSSTNFCEREIPTTMMRCGIEDLPTNEAALMGVATHTIG